MILSEAQSRIKQRLGFRTDLDTEIGFSVRDAQARLEQEPELPWFLRSPLTTLSTVSGQETVPLPADFLREAEDEALYLYDATTDNPYRELEKNDVDNLRALWPGSGEPRAYALDVSDFRIFPTPDAVYTLKFIYMAADSIPSSGVENKWLKYIPGLLIAEAGRDIAAAVRDKDALAIFSQDIVLQRRQLRLMQSRRMDNFRFVMGGRD